MARITVEDCLDKVDNRFELVMVASKRARALATGGQEARGRGHAESDKPTVTALREIADGHITREEIMNPPKIEEELVLDIEIAVDTPEVQVPPKF